MSPPIISPYKKWFCVKRLIRTFLGGPKLVLSIPVSFLQLLIYIFPVVIICDVNTIADHYFGWEWKAVLSGVGIFLFDIALTFLIWVLKTRKEANVRPDGGVGVEEEDEERREQGGNGGGGGGIGGFVTDGYGNPSTSLFDEEETVPKDGILKSSTWKFIAPNVNMTGSHFLSVAASAVTVLLCEPVLVDNSVHSVLKGFVIFTVCNARYSCVVCAAPEVATFDPVNRRHLFYRPFYVSLCAFVHFGYLIIRKIKMENNEEILTTISPSGDEEIKVVEEGEGAEEIVSVIPTVVAFILAFMPVIWLSGILPPLDALFPWLFETILSGLGARSIGYTYFGTTVSLAFALLGPLATFILSQEPKVTLILECLCGFLISCDTGSMPKLKASLCEDVPVKYFLQQLIKPFVTILCSVLSVFLVGTITTSEHHEHAQQALLSPRERSLDESSGEIYHPVLASISIFLLVTTKICQSFDIVHKKDSRLVLGLFSMWAGLLTLILHIWLSLELMTEYFGVMSSSKSLETRVIHSLNQLLPCILTIRIFALAVSQPHDSTINIFLTYLYQSLIQDPAERGNVKFVNKLFIISLVHSVVKKFLGNLRMTMIFVYATFKSTLIPKKYTAGAVILSLPMTLFSVVLSSLVRGMNTIPLFTLPIFIVGFPRPLSFWKGIWFVRGCSRNQTEKILPLSTSVDWTIYSEAAPLLVHQFAKHCEENKLALAPGSCYLARYDDRLVFLRVLSSGWKFCYLQVKGLEIQEQTSCHYQEAAWVDEIFGKYLPSSSSTATKDESELHPNSETSHLKILCSSPKWMLNSLEPKFNLSVASYSESKSQIPNFLSQKGKLIFRDMFFRAFSYLWIKGNPAFQGESYRRTIASGVPLGKPTTESTKHPRNGFDSQFKNNIMRTIDGYSIPPLHNTISNSPDMNGNRSGGTGFGEFQLPTGSFLSNESIRRASAPMRQHPHLRDMSSWTGSVSYPLIPGLPNLADENEEDELEELVGLPGSANSVMNKSNEDIGRKSSKEIKPESISPLSVLNGGGGGSGILRNNNLGGGSSGGWDGLPQPWMKQCVGDAIPHNAVKARVEKVCWKAWEIAFGTFDDLYEVDMARFYRREFANSLRSVGYQQEKPEFEQIAVRAFRYATKLTLDEIYANDIEDTLEDNLGQSSSPLLLSPASSSPSTSSLYISRSEEDEKEIFSQLTNFEKKFRFCSYDEVPYWMTEKAKHIVSISPSPSSPHSSAVLTASAASRASRNVVGEQSILRIFNYENGVPFSVGKLSESCVEGIWASLNIELLYLTSDDDERYSIQNNKYLLRNLCAQSAQTLGYPVYEATFRVNLFDYSLEQLSS